MRRNLPGPEGLAGGGASAVLRGLAVALTTARAARLEPRLPSALATCTECGSSVRTSPRVFSLLLTGNI